MECSNAANMLKLQTFLPAAAVIMRSNLVLGFINSSMLWKRLPFVLTKHCAMQIVLKQQNLNCLTVAVVPKHRYSKYTSVSLSMLFFSIFKK